MTTTVSPNEDNDPNLKSDRRSVLDESTTWRIHEDAETALLIDGRDYYRAFHQAASQAKKSILLMGWQFDSDVELLRGDDLPQGLSPEKVRLLALLEELSRQNPELEVRILAWDHSVLFALERELLQKLYFDAIDSDRFFFRWDDTVPIGGSHHQKVAIIDGKIAFFGSQDICQARWDDSTHRLTNELRTSRGESHQPYHEVQVAVRGEAVRTLVDLFVNRWLGATGEQLDAAALIATDPSLIDVATTLPMPRARMGFARTIPAIEGRPYVDEVAKLYARVIGEAERLIYIESQYLTSCAVRDALLERMRDDARPKLDIVIILPNKPEKLKEEMTIGVPQAVLQRVLHQAAREYGHNLGVYNVVAGMKTDANGEAQPLHVYIHAKLMIVDDRYFVVGSANLTNRSMTIDSEIVAAYEARPNDRALKNAIRRVRTRLLMEHVGGEAPVRALLHKTNLVATLDALVDKSATRLRHHKVEEDEPSPLVKTVHELTLEFLDPWDGGNETCPPAA